MINKVWFSILLFFISLASFCQVEINKSIVFISSESNERLVNDIETTTNVDLLSANEVITNNYQYAQTSLSNDTLYAIFEPQIENLIIGLKIYLKLPLSIGQNINYLKLNSQLAKRIYLNLNENLLKNNLNEDEIITTIYDGNAFQTLLSNQSKKCPDGFVDINSSYCVSQYRQGPGLFKDNVAYCNSINAKLCSWADWYNACVNNGGEITDMDTSGSEWVDTGGNYADYVKIVGNTTCERHGFGQIGTEIHYFRCCYKK